MAGFDKLVEFLCLRRAMQIAVNRCTLNPITSNVHLHYKNGPSAQSRVRIAL